MSLSRCVLLLVLSLLMLSSWALLAAGCAGRSGAPRCDLEVLALDEYAARQGDVRVAYRVRGDAGAEGKVWLAARNAEGRWISGSAFEVGPGPFEAIVGLRLTGRAEDYTAVLEVGGRRCAEDAPSPSR